MNEVENKKDDIKDAREPLNERENLELEREVESRQVYNVHKVEEEGGENNYELRITNYESELLPSENNSEPETRDFKNEGEVENGSNYELNPLASGTNDELEAGDFDEEEKIESQRVDEDAVIDNRSDNKITRRQKVLMASLMIFSIGMLGAWARYFQANLNDNVDSVVLARKAGQNQATADQAQTGTSTSADPRNLDTDHDGLSDWDELNAYQTSPYLEDTDGDGISDGEEIKNSTDPLCPTGKTCSADNTQTEFSIADPAAVPDKKTPTIVSPIDTTAIVNSVTNELVASPEAITNNNSAVADTSGTTIKVKTDEQTSQALLTGKLDAKTLRQVLKDSGMDETKLSQISDEVLMQNYKEMAVSGN